MLSFGNGLRSPESESSYQVSEIGRFRPQANDLNRMLSSETDTNFMSENFINVSMC